MIKAERVQGMEAIDYAGIVNGMYDDRKQAEHYILNYEIECDEYKQRKHDELFGSQWNPEKVGGKGNLPGKPVEAEAVRSAQYDMEHTEYWWLKAVEIALRTFGERKRIFIKVRKEAESLGQGCKPVKGRRGWVVYTQRRYSEEIQMRFINDDGWMGERTVKAWWAQILDTIVEIYLRLEKLKRAAL